MPCRLTFLWLLCLALVPCWLAGQDAGSGKNGTPAAQPDYTLQASDLIQVQIFQESDLNREVRLSQECAIVLPLIGTVQLEGKTVRQAEELIRALYDRDYLVNPQVNIMVREYASRTVILLGAISTPGVVRFPPEQPLTLLDAIARAGGFNRLADRSKVKLTRTLPDGKSETHVIDVDDIIKGVSKDTVWLLQKDDVIYVPERIF